ncbi:MAG: protein transport protein sft2 [Phylliscum demangeonii]|nr:MAG: protein transport protein sft2 [Phylliscum demangeonii]
MASAAFRESMTSLGWSRTAPDLPVAHPPPAPARPKPSVLSRLTALNPFAEPSHVRLPTPDQPGAILPAPSRREEEESWFVLSRWDRILVFAGCNLGALLCFLICFFLFPALSLRPRKFAILWSVGSIFFLLSWAALMGPWPYLQHLLSGPRRAFTAAYLASIGLTLYFSLGLRSTLLTLLSSVIQLACLLWYLVSYFPLGGTGLRVATTFGARRAAAWMTA